MSKYDFSPEARERAKQASREFRAKQKERMELDPEYAEKVRLARVEQRRKQVEKNPDYHRDQRARQLARDPGMDRKRNAKKWEKIKADPHLTELRAQTVRKHKLKVKYGITPEDFDRMWTEQSGCCDICGKALEKGYHTHVDHCHETNTVRGLLCLKCNTALGKLGEDEDIILSLLEYVRKHKTSGADRNPVTACSENDPTTRQTAPLRG